MSCCNAASSSVASRQFFHCPLCLAGRKKNLSISSALGLYSSALRKNKFANDVGMGEFLLAKGAAAKASSPERSRDSCFPQPVQMSPPSQETLPTKYQRSEFGAPQASHGAEVLLIENVPQALSFKCLRQILNQEQLPLCFNCASKIEGQLLCVI